jgi:hypothetical protein
LEGVDLMTLFGTKDSVFDTMVQFFKEDNWNVTRIEGKPILRMGVRGKNGAWSCFAQAREQQHQFVFYSVLDSKVPDGKRTEAAEYVTRANYGMVIGNFEFDFADGEVRYKTSIDVEGDRLTTALIKPMVIANVAMMDKYLPGLMSVIWGNVKPSEAIATVEGPK